MKFSRNVLPYILLSMMVVSITLLFCTNPDKERDLNEQRYTGILLAQVVSIREVTKLNYSETGSDIFISHRVVDYTFCFKEKWYSGQDIVPARLRYKKINLRLSEQKNVYIKFDEKNPSNSIITRNIKGLY